MNTLMFFIIGGMLIGYAILDGLNIGAGAVHLLLGRTNDERRTHFAAIGPLWWGCRRPRRFKRS